MKYSEVKNQMRGFNEKHGIERKVCTKYTEDGQLVEMVAEVVLSNNCLRKEYPKEQRTYRFDNYNKALTSSDMGYSIFAQCVADEDIMRIENLNDSNIEEAEIIKVVE